MFDLFLFYSDVDLVEKALSGGIAGVVVDLERRGKEARQKGFDTQINSHTTADITKVKQSTSAHVICRINGFGPHTAEEMDKVVQAGADEVLIPMVSTEEEVRSVLEMANGRCGVGAMVETVEAVEIVDALCRYPLTRIFVGLNDLWIARGTNHLFNALGDGTVEQIRSRVNGVAFGFAGLTLPDKGYPLPCQHLINEMSRLDTSFSFLRRAFMRDVQGLDPAAEVRRILKAIDTASARSAQMMRADSERFQGALSDLPQGPWE